MEGIVITEIRDEYRLEVGNEAMGSFFLSLRTGVVCLKEVGGDEFMEQDSLCRAPEGVVFDS